DQPRRPRCPDTAGGDDAARHDGVLARRLVGAGVLPNPAGHANPRRGGGAARAGHDVVLARRLMRAGVIRNPQSHANRREGEVTPPRSDVLFAQPEAPGDVAAEVMAFAQAGCELVVIDGGDGTVRQVLSALPAAFGDHPPLLSVVASGKTNILAFDLGVRGSWTLNAALAALDDPDARIRLRSPLQVVRDDGAEPPQMGFVFGCAATVRQWGLAPRRSPAPGVHNRG